MDNKIEEIRANILNIYKMSINDKFTDYDEMVDIVSDYHLDRMDIYENYDKYADCIVNEEYEDISKETLLNIHIEFINRINKKYNVNVDIESIGIETYFIRIFDDAMYEVISDDNPLSIKQVFDMIDYWTKEVDIYISNISK
ncbi:MAG: hypothetical protein ACRC3Y_03660 [Romboutsia sp.]|uniref:hypothetical protein n=1 Tax=Romboutsia sp. TaxID=1965302 RepID=UPI003F3EB7B9